MSRQPSLPIPIGVHIHTQLADTFSIFRIIKHEYLKSKAIQNCWQYFSSKTNSLSVYFVLARNSPSSNCLLDKLSPVVPLTSATSTSITSLACSPSTLLPLSPAAVLPNNNHQVSLSSSLTSRSSFSLDETLEEEVGSKSIEEEAESSNNRSVSCCCCCCCLSLMQLLIERGGKDCILGMGYRMLEGTYS